MRANRKNSIRTWGARLWTAWDLPGRISRGKGGLARAWQAWRADPQGHLARPFRRLGRALPRLRCRGGAVVLVVGGLLATLSVWAWVQPPKHYSETEERGTGLVPGPQVGGPGRRVLCRGLCPAHPGSVPPAGQLPHSEGAERPEAVGAKDLDHLYQAGTYLAQMEYPLRPEMLDHAAKKIQWVYDTYLAGTDVTCYLSMIPGKNAYLAEEYGYPSLDYGELFQYMRAHTRPWSMWTLPTCCPWRITTTPTAIGGRRRFLDVAQRLAGAMGAEIDGPEAYHVQRLARPFTGRYAIQMGLTMAWEDLYYLTSPTLDQCLVAVYDQGGRPQRKKGL